MRVSKLFIGLTVVLVVLSLFTDVDAKKKHKKHKKHKNKKNKNKNKPNFVFFLVDDLGYNDVGYHDSSIISPAIDELAAEGMIIENNYVAPVCTPSRGAILTGQYPFHIGEQNGVIRSDSPMCLTKEHPLISEALQDLGYRTYMLGKWHQGFCSLNCTPPHRGFDEFLGYYNGEIGHYDHTVDGFLDWRDGDDVDMSSRGEYAATVVGNRAVQNINDHAASHADKPLYMYFSFPTVHSPMEAPTEYLEKYADEPNYIRQTVKAMVSITDDIINDVVTALKNNNMYDNTVIMFTSDNGGEQGYSSSLPLRGGKASSWEGGVRVPGFVHSPLMKKSAGTVTKGLFHESDWYATMVSLAGGKVGDWLDGVDQTDFLFNGKDSARNEVVIQYDQTPAPFSGRGIIRQGKWKLIKGFPGVWNGYGMDQFMTHTGKSLLEISDDNTVSKTFGTYGYPWGDIAKYANSIDDSTLLFDLEADPTETTDLSADNPDVVSDMLALLEKYGATAAPVPQVPSTNLCNPAKYYNGVWSPGWC